MMYVANAMAVQMLPAGDVTITKKDLSIEAAAGTLAGADEIISALGHADIARLVSEQLGMDLPMNRISITLQKSDQLLVAGYYGPRLPEGATTLPEGAEIRYTLIQVVAA